MRSKLAFITTIVVRSLGQLTRYQLLSDFVNTLLYPKSKSSREVNSQSTPWPAVPYVAVWNVQAKHLLQTHPLCAYLQVGRFAMAHTGLVLYWPHTLAVNFNGVGTP